MIYENINTFAIETLPKNVTHREKYSAIVTNLDYPTCKEIALQFATLDEYKKSYKKDKALNNMLHNHHPINECSELKAFNKMVNTYWDWDLMGRRMLHNPNRTITIQSYSLSDCTCIAKECVRMIIEEE